MALSFVAASGGQGGSISAATRATTYPTGTQAGDFVQFLVVVGASATWQDLAGWTLEVQATNPSGTVHTAAVYTRQVQAGDLATPPTFTASTLGKSAWVGIAWRPGAGETPSVYAEATTLITGVGTTATPNAVSSTDANSVSMVFNSNREQVTQATAITQTPATNWTEPANGDQSTAVGTTTATRQVGAHLAYRTAVGTGNIAPGAFTFNVSVIDIAFHMLLRSAAATSFDLTGLGVAQAQAATGPTLQRIFNLTGLNAAQAQAASSVTLSVSAFDQRPRILGQSFVPNDMATW